MKVDISAEWDDYVKTLKDLGVDDRVIETKRKKQNEIKQNEIKQNE